MDDSVQFSAPGEVVLELLYPSVELKPDIPVDEEPLDELYESLGISVIISLKFVGFGGKLSVLL